MTPIKKYLFLFRIIPIVLMSLFSWKTTLSANLCSDLTQLNIEKDSAQDSFFSDLQASPLFQQTTPERQTQVLRFLSKLFRFKSQHASIFEDSDPEIKFKIDMYIQAIAANFISNPNLTAAPHKADFTFFQFDVTHQIKPIHESLIVMDRTLGQHLRRLKNSTSRDLAEIGIDYAYQNALIELIHLLHKRIKPLLSEERSDTSFTYASYYYIYLYYLFATYVPGIHISDFNSAQRQQIRKLTLRFSSSPLNSSNFYSKKYIINKVHDSFFEFTPEMHSTLILPTSSSLTLEQMLAPPILPVFTFPWLMDLAWHETTADKCENSYSELKKALCFENMLFQHHSNTSTLSDQNKTYLLEENFFSRLQQIEKYFDLFIFIEQQLHLSNNPQLTRGVHMLLFQMHHWQRHNLNSVDDYINNTLRTLSLLQFEKINDTTKKHIINIYNNYTHPRLTSTQALKELTEAGDWLVDLLVSVRRRTKKKANVVFMAPVSANY